MHLTAHLADSNPNRTACGQRWEAWQEPMPTDDEIGLDNPSYSARVELRKSDQQRQPQHGDVVFQCRACWQTMAAYR